MAMNNSTAKTPNSILNHLREKCAFLSDNQLQLLVEKLNAIGVEQEHDLKYLEINDLIDINIMSLIQARKVLKILKQSTEAEVPVCEGGSFTLLQPPNSPNSSISFTASSIAASSIASMGVSESSTDESPGPSECRSRPTCQTAWATSYLIPWEKFPKSFLTSCKNNRSPSQSDRREVVRILVDDITGVCSRPTSRDIYIVSSKLVDTYKTSLMDRFGDTRIGSGYSSFINRIQDRLNNLNRKRLSSDSGCSKSPATKRGYGWLTEAIFEEIPREEYLDSKEFLKRQARFTDVDFSLITEVMNKTYPLQREEISRGDMSIAEIEKNWPFLFTKTCALKHFEKLTGVNLPREFFVHSSSKIKTLLKYMEKLEGSRKEIKKNI